jgi:hypothetical protein
MNGRRQSAQDLAQMIGTVLRQQKIDAGFLPIANAAAQKYGAMERVMLRARTHLTR